MNVKQALFLAALVIALTIGPGSGYVTSASEPGNTAFERTWNRTDRPVMQQQVSRTWMWGPQPFTGPMMEMTTDRPGTGREVQYFDKSRMERSTDPGISPYSIWHVTNGLLARELVTGMLQLGDNDFEERAPAEVNAAGDWDDPTGPTYATFQRVLGEPPIEQGAVIDRRIDRAGNVTSDSGLAALGVSASVFVPETNHTVASPFWEFMNASGLVQETGPTRVGELFPNPFYATGYPITEAYWANVKVANEYTDVLIQVFERRVLTYTPGNPEGWQVEAGNVGRHYFEWRYGISPPEPVDAPQTGFLPLGPAPLPDGVGTTGTEATVVIANMSPEPMDVSFAGTGGQVAGDDTIAACPECQLLELPPDSCHPAAPSVTLTVPAGSYAVTTSRQTQSGTVSQSGIWTLLPGGTYGACFFTIR